MNKNKVLELLLENRPEPISGQNIADNLSISRNAVWKHINSLKKEGFQILSSKAGYMLVEESENISALSIEGKLSKPLNIYVFPSLPSTNTYAINNFESLNKPALIIAMEQTKGRGRIEKTFSSEKDMGIYMSYLVENKSLQKNISLVTAMTSVAVAKSIESLCGHKVQIKWVNDIFYNGLKACGILTEGITNFETGTISHIVVGIGINLSKEGLGPELEGIAGPVTDTAINKNSLIAEISNRFFSLYEDLVMNNKDFIKDYRNLSLILGKNIKFKDFSTSKTFKGIAKDIDDDGRLVIEKEDGSQFLALSGQISVIPNFL